MRAQDDPALVEPLLQTLRDREADFDSRAFSQAVDTLAFLARDMEDKEAVREFLLGQTGSKKERVRLGALRALGTLGDDRAVAALQTFHGAPNGAPEREAAERAVAQLRETRSNAAEVRNLRGEVLDLQKENRGLRDEFDALKKQFEALHPPEAKGAKAKKAGR
jgi:HEAT repeat protein